MIIERSNDALMAGSPLKFPTEKLTMIQDPAGLFTVERPQARKTKSLHTNEVK